ncbi:MAG: mechanosensitive ion channel [Nitrosopumilus sp.]|nr:mechanosensitive ion channel [Nitrosopumilus sp.]MDH3515375.1 mechanosensitive ion channel [Nitrosopumilus sp.]MDH3564324.1 mechanosensitive ion channel [Nitrosopumilus sp.]MDH5417141.1 mechanosensitive ion channel [Nitrosopumilus sp.]MDH5555006.1 mechanosensitive ion channel [Nitrosopumilus sp.]
MAKTRSSSFRGVPTLATFALFSVLLSTNIIFHTAYAQENPVGFLYEPGIEALTAFVTVVAESAPKVIAAVILLIIGLVAGKIIGRVIEKSASKLLQKVTKNKDDNSDDVVTRSTSSRDSSKLIATSVRWFVYLFFIIAAINALEFEQLSTALTDLWLWVPNLLAFILIVVIGLIIANFIGKWLDQELIKKEFGGSKYVIIGVKTVIYAIIFAIALTQLGIGDTIIPILISAFAWSIAIGVGAAIAIGLGFALKDILPAAINTAAKQRSVLKIGQKVRIGEISGTITAVELLHIIIATENNESVIIPTKNISNSSITIIGETHG